MTVKDIEIQPFRLKFSVITPYLRRTSFIAGAIESVLVQSYSDFEHIIVSHGSTNDLPERLKAYPHLRILSAPETSVYEAVNCGLASARGDAVILLNSDDILAEGAMQLAAEIFQHTAGTEMVSGGCEIFEQDQNVRQIINRYLEPRQYALNLANVTDGLAIINARIFRRRVFDRVGLFDRDCEIAPDRDWLIRAARAKIPDAPVSRITYRYRWDGGALTIRS
ncbi:MAG: glycosyltransferase [Verrucomicrobia bacterium]|nr:glycosyltransferase [Verrucomicrobiota bacterium]